MLHLRPPHGETVPIRAPLAPNLGALAVLVALVALSLPSAASAAAPQGPCTPIGAPAVWPIVIDQPGSYCLTGDLEVDLDDGPALVVDADGVQLDFAGFSLRQIGADRGTSIGVVLHGRGLRLQGGTITGFARGIWAGCDPADQGQIIRDMEVRRCSSPAVALGCPGTVFRNNAVTTVLTPVLGSDAGMVAVAVDAPYVRILHNDMHEVRGKGSHAVLVGDHQKHTLVLGNRISDAGHGVSTAGAASEALCRDNVTLDVDAPYDCLDLGDNW